MSTEKKRVEQRAAEDLNLRLVIDRLNHGHYSPVGLRKFAEKSGEVELCKDLGWYGELESLNDEWNSDARRLLENSRRDIAEAKLLASFAFQTSYLARRAAEKAYYCCLALIAYSLVQLMSILWIFMQFR